MEPIPQNSSRMLMLGMSVTVLVLAFFLFFAASASPKGPAMPPQPDTLIFLQYARAIAEGHPYCYIPGDAPTTASTSHLYPFLLAVPYALGAHGEALYVFSLLFNIVFLLMIVALVWVIARRLTPETAGYAVFLTALSGPLTYTVLQQSDIGIFTVLMLAYFAALLYERHKTAALFLMLTVWCRPEGFVVAAATLGYGVVACWQPQRRRMAMLGLWGCANVAGVLLLNKLLTGAFLFQSLSGKGYFAQFPFVGAVNRTILDGGALTADFLLGLGRPDRLLYTLPLVGGLLVLAGLIGRLIRTEDRTTTADGCWTLGALGALGMIASGGWQGFNHDRHIAWLFPFFAIYTAAGIQLIKRALPHRPVWHLAGLIVLLYQAATLPFFAIENAKILQGTASRMEVISEAQQMLPPEKSIIVSAFGGACYLMPGRHFVCVGGYGSPQLVAWRDNRTNIEILRRHPELRGDYWLIERRDIADIQLCSFFVGRQVIAEKTCFPSVNVMALYEADWSSLAAPRTPLATNAVAAVQGWRQVDELDVGYVADEKSHAYETFTRLPNLRLPVFAVMRNIGDYKITEAARLVLGADTFRIHAAPGRDLRIVMRTSANLTGNTVTWFDIPCDSTDAKFGPDFRLHVDVDGMDAGTNTVTISTNETVWSEVVLDVPGAAICRPDPEITISGDHIAAYYWFYQKPDAHKP